MNEQCNGTENANTCEYMEEEGVCSCDMEYALIGGTCLKSKKKSLCILNTL